MQESQHPAWYHERTNVAITSANPARVMTNSDHALPSHARARWWWWWWWWWWWHVHQADKHHQCVVLAQAVFTKVAAESGLRLPWQKVPKEFLLMAPPCVTGKVKRRLESVLL